MKRFLILAALLPLFALSCNPEGTGTTPVTPISEDGKSLGAPAAEPMSWVAVDRKGEKMENYPEQKEDKVVAIFYFIWHGCHGYDTNVTNNYVTYPTAADTQSPYNLDELYKANPENPAFGDFWVCHHWGEPYLGYYLSDDRWVYRKHAQMLADAGVDVIFLDLTNGLHYITNIKILCEEFTYLRRMGCKTPQFAALLDSDPSEVFNVLDAEIYAQKKYKDLWFMWDGKPLILADPDQIASARKANFTFRQSWFANDDWYSELWNKRNGEDLWPWGSLYPQKPGYHQGKVECVSVVPATHPISNVGRSYDPFTNTEPEVKTPGEGIFFKAQFNHALELDPKMLFFTGWNEWFAQKLEGVWYVDMMGIPSRQFAGGCYFTDTFNHEFSRDIEPLRGDFGDAYYYMMADMIRKFKGTPAEKTYSKTCSIKIDGKVDDWSKAEATYGDDKGDATLRSHPGWGRIGTITNDTARNDIELAAVANDGKNLYFYVQTSEALSDPDDSDWMKLFITTEGKGWEGFDFMVEGGKLYASKVDYYWKEVSKVDQAISERFLELAIPMSALGIADPGEFSIDFKWIDNAACDGDIETCLTDGDSAPDGRFRYRYNFKK